MLDSVNTESTEPISMFRANGLPFTELMGDFFERIGQPRIAGLLFGHLLICEPPEQNSSQLQKAVSASAGSINTMLRQLQTSGFVERRSEPGSRRLWYWIAPGAFSMVLTKRMQMVTELKNLAEIGLAEIDTDKKKKEGNRLREMRDCYKFFETEFPTLIQRYNSKAESRNE